MSTAHLYRAVQLTARASALLFAAAQATSALGPRAAPASRSLYLAFMTAHATLFTVVARYAKVNDGHNLFPGGRNMNEVGPATWLIAAMFVGVYLGQVPRSPWYAAPATAVAGAVTANVLAQRLRQERPLMRTFARRRPHA